MKQLEVCPRCLGSNEADMMTQSCSTCGFSYLNFVKYDPQEQRRMNPEDGSVYRIRRKRRLRGMKQMEAEVYVGVLTVLRFDEDKGYTKWELREWLGVDSVTPITKALKMMERLGVVKEYEEHWFFEITQRRNARMECKECGRKSVEDVKRRDCRCGGRLEVIEGRVRSKDQMWEQEVSLMEERDAEERRVHYVQWENEEGEVEGEFIWLTDVEYEVIMSVPLRRTEG